MTVYILYSKSLSQFYCGQTDDIKKRLQQHNSGRNKSTKRGIPWIVIHTIKCDDRREAVRLESQIKKRGIKRYLGDNGVGDPLG